MIGIPLTLVSMTEMKSSDIPILSWPWVRLPTPDEVHKSLSHAAQNYGNWLDAKDDWPFKGKKPEKLKAVAYKSAPKQAAHQAVRGKGEPRKDMVGVDVFLQWAPGKPAELGTQLEKLAAPDCRLTMVSNRGVKVYPGGFEETFLSDNWSCRFFSNTRDKPLTHRQICTLLQRIADAGLDFIKTESLCNFDGQRAYSLDQGE